MKCSICNSPDRAEIENAILQMSADVPESERYTLERIADQFNCNIDDLKVHALFHAPLTFSGESDHSSLTRKVKLKEVDALAAVSNEYLVTLKSIGRRINKLSSVSSIDAEDQEKMLQIAKLLTKPMVDLYIGLGGEIRQNAKTMAELDHMLNGPKDGTANGIAALAQAIKESAQ